MMNFLFKMTGCFVGGSGWLRCRAKRRRSAGWARVARKVRFFIQNDGFCNKNDAICFKDVGFCIQNDGFCIKNEGRGAFSIEESSFSIEGC